MCRKRLATSTLAASEHATLVQRAVVPSRNSKSAISTVLHWSGSPDVKSGAEDVVQVSIDDDMTERKVFFPPCYPQTYRPTKVWITIFQADKVQSPLHAVSWNHENDFLGSLQAEKLEYRAGQMAGDSPASVTLGTVGVSILFEHLVK